MATVPMSNLPAMDTTIADQVTICLQMFEDTIERAEIDENPFVPATLWQDQHGRFRMWASNIGAHQRGKSSLDARLQHASHMRAQFLRILKFIREEFEDIQDQSDESDTSVDETHPGREHSHRTDNEVSEDRQSYRSIRDLIGTLFETSMIVQRPTRIDLMRGVAEEVVGGFTQNDQMHVADKFPRLEYWLQIRLSSNVTLMRQRLQYYQRHSKKLAKGLEGTIDDGSKSVVSSTVVAQFRDEDVVMGGMDGSSETSGTVYDPSLFASQTSLTIPAPPMESQEGQPFICPYCHEVTIIKASSDTDRLVHWGRHIFRDLRPYVCVFDDCSRPGRRYERRREWILHLTGDHDSTSWRQTKTCILCGDDQINQDILTHLARHLEELALWVVRTFPGAVQEEENISLEHEVDVGGGSDENDVSISVESEDRPSNTTTIKGSTAGRKPQAQVASACVNCKKKHLRCDNRRPCRRCMQSGKEVR